MTSEEIRQRNQEILGRYLPPSAVEPIFNFLNSNSVQFNISRKRTSKLGDYRMPHAQHPYHEISVNGDLSPHMFLLVLLHEMAHLLIFKTYGRTVQPHGHEWQQQYRNLLVQYFNGGHFPEETRNLFTRYTAKIPLNRAAGQELEQRLREIDNPQQVSHELTLKELEPGTTFILTGGRRMVLRLEERIRTRFKCTDVFTKKQYSVSGNATVDVVPDGLLDEAMTLYS